MKSWTVLSAAALVLSSGHARAQMGVVAQPKVFELPPYKIAVTPPGSALEGAPVRIRPIATGAAAIAQQVCRLEVWREGNAHGAFWAGASDAGCSREEAMNLPAGRYVVKLAMSWETVGGPVTAVRGSRRATAETPYEVTSTEKLQMTKCEFSPIRPMAGRAANVSWEVRNLASAPLGPFRVSIVVSHQAVDSFTVAALAAGAAFSRTAPWTPQTPGTFRVQCIVDPENAVNESPSFLKNNTMNNEITVVSADVLRPVIVLGTLRLSPVGWSQDYTVCNVDVDADYRPEMVGCARPCNGGWNGVPSRDFTPDRVSANGSGISPGCPGGLVSRTAFKPGPADGPRNHYEDKTYTLKVRASREGRSAESSVPVRVPQYCGMLSFPICVETEGAKSR